MLRKLVWGDREFGPPRPGLDKPAPPRKEGDLPMPFMLVEDFEGEFRDVGVAGGLEPGPLVGGGFLFRPDMAARHVPSYHELLIIGQ